MTLIVGLTGNIASGKSTVARLFAERGAVVIDADQLAREAVMPGSRGLAAIAARWPSVISPSGDLDRAALRRIVFADPRERAGLDAIVHPEVARLRDQRVEAARARGAKIVVYDVPLLFEAGLERSVDVVVLTEASPEIRRERIMRDRGLTAADADAMIAAQMPSSEKRARADYVVENDGDTAALRARVDEVWNALARGKTRA